MIEMLALECSKYLKKQVPHHPSSVEVLTYSIAVFLNVTFIVAGSICLSFVTGRTIEIIVILLSFSLLRQFSGGLHLRSGTSCALVSTALFTLLSFFNAPDPYFIHMVTVLTLILVAIYAPSHYQRQYNNVPKTYYPWLRLISILLVCSNFILVSSPLAASFFMQSLTLIKRKEVNDS